MRGDGARLTQTLTWHYLLAVNLRLLVAPLTLCADYSHDTIPLVRPCETPLLLHETPRLPRHYLAGASL